MYKLRLMICFICFIIFIKVEINIRNVSFYIMGGNFLYFLNFVVYMILLFVINSCLFCLDNLDCFSFLYNIKI